MGIFHTLIIMVLIYFTDLGLYNILYLETYYMCGTCRYVEFKGKIEFSHLQKHKSPLGVRCPYLSRMEKEGCAFTEGK